MEKKTRTRFSDAEKVAILRRHLLEKELISLICDEVGLQPTQFYRRFESGRPSLRTEPPPSRPSHGESLSRTG